MTSRLILGNVVAANIVREVREGDFGAFMLVTVVPVEVTADIVVVLGGISCVALYNVAGKVVMPSAIVKEAVFRTQQLPSKHELVTFQLQQKIGTPGVTQL